MLRGSETKTAVGPGIPSDLPGDSDREGTQGFRSLLYHPAECGELWLWGRKLCFHVLPLRGIN